MIVVGGVGQLWQGDLDVGRRAAERLAAELDDRDDVSVEDFYYGAVAVAQRLEELQPDALVLVGAVARGRPAGTVEVRTLEDFDTDGDEAQLAVMDAVTGYVAIDLLLQVGTGLGALPLVTTVVEIEPACVDPGDRLSPEVGYAFEAALDATRAEVARLRRTYALTATVDHD